jgi:hypothetical protein
LELDRSSRSRLRAKVWEVTSQARLPSGIMTGHIGAFSLSSA